MFSDTSIRISITAGDVSVAGALQHSAASASLVAQLPVELRFRDFDSQEKLAKLPAPLDLDGMPAGSSAEPGMIGYYAPHQVLVLYYAAVGYYEGIIPLGTFDDVDAVRDSPAFTATVEVQR